jgi:hypothetical protein
LGGDDFQHIVLRGDHEVLCLRNNVVQVHSSPGGKARRLFHSERGSEALLGFVEPTPQIGPIRLIDVSVCWILPKPNAPPWSIRDVSGLEHHDEFAIDVGE